MEHWFDGATNTLTIGSGDDELFTYVLIDPCNPPLEIMLGWYDGSWEHHAYWGGDLINQGTAPTGRFYIGPLPAPFCSFRMLGDSIQYASDRRCYPPMPIDPPGRFRPDMELPE